MRNNTLPLFFILCSLFLVSCSEEIELDYRDVEPFYVIQGDVTDTETKVLITRSRQMSDSVRGKGLDVAEVRISDDLGRSERLVFAADGYYRSPSGWTGETGRTYRMDVKMDGKEYTATSFMMPRVTLDSVYFVWLETAGMRMCLLKYHYTYPNDSTSNAIRQGRLFSTQCYMTRNGRFYRNNSDRQVNPARFHNEKLIGCMPETMMEEDDPDDRESILYENDRIHLDLWSVDESVSEYFSSMKAGKSNASNPISNISGGVQGYFSAHNVCSIDTVFRKSEIRVSK